MVVRRPPSPFLPCPRHAHTRTHTYKTGEWADTSKKFIGMQAFGRVREGLGRSPKKTDRRASLACLVFLYFFFFLSFLLLFPLRRSYFLKGGAGFVQMGPR